MAEWTVSIIGTGWPFAWISLDESDNDPARFWEYLIFALKQAQPDLGELLSGIFRQDYTRSDVCFLTTLINAISILPDHFSLILDDYHFIDQEVIHEDLSFLLRNLPANLHLVIASRKEPPLAIARLRAQNEVIDIGYDDLKFTVTETNTFLTQVMSLALPSYQVSRLNQLTEGWITGLVLAAPAMQRMSSSSEINNFIANFGGDYQHILNFITNEVLIHLEPNQQIFLLETSILNELNESLCNAVVGIQGSHTILNDLGQANLFLHPINGFKHCYRYHALFADVLQLRLKQTYPQTQIDQLHLAAYQWYRSRNDITHAIPHALAAGQGDLAAQIIEEYLSQTLDHTSLVILDWFKRLPDEILDRYPRLLLQGAMLHLVHGFTQEAETQLNQIERSLPGCPLDPNEILTIENGILAVRKAIQCVVGNYHDSILQAKHVLATLVESGPPRLLLEYYLSLAYEASGDQTFPVDELIATIQTTYQQGDSSTYLFFQGLLADIYEMRGQLYLAAQVYQQAIDYIVSNDLNDQLLAIIIQMGLSDIYLEWNELEMAERFAHRAKDQFLHYRTGEPCWLHSIKTCILLAKNSFAQGDLDSVQEYLEIAYKRAQVANTIPSILKSVEAVRVCFWLAKNDLRMATAWARNRRMFSNGAKQEVYQVDRLQIARILLAENDPQQAIAWLDELIPELESSNQGKLLVNALIIKAVAFWESGARREAVQFLFQALARTEKENFIRPYIELHPRIGELLKATLDEYRKSAPRWPEQLPTLDYIERLLKAFTQAPRLVSGYREKKKTVDPSVEKLTWREKEVLTLLAEGFSSGMIAQKMSVSLSTAKTHIRNAYRKLGAHDRSYALSRAQELGLI